jgi:aminopeptidase N
VRIKQIQDLNTFPVFKFPLDIDIYIDGKTQRKRVWVNDNTEDFSFTLPHKPDLVNVDATKSLLCTKEEKKSVQQWAFQYKNCPLYADRLEALKNCASFASIPEAAEIILLAMNDKSSDLRERAIGMTEKLPAEYKNKIKEKLAVLAKNDEKSYVRALAIEQLANNFSDDTLIPLYRESVSDKSYSVAGASLSALAMKDEKSAMQIAKQFEGEKSRDILITVAQVYSRYGNDENHPFFVELSQKVSGWSNISFAMTYTDFLKRCSDDTINVGIKILENIARTEGNRWIQYFGQKGIKDLTQMYADREQKLTEQISRLKTKKNNSPQLKSLEQELTRAQNQKQKLTLLYNSLKISP